MVYGLGSNTGLPQYQQEKSISPLIKMGVAGAGLYGLDKYVNNSFGAFDIATKKPIRSVGWKNLLDKVAGNSSVQGITSAYKAAQLMVESYLA